MADSAERLGAALEGRYRLERELGAGGMATVYLAQDLRHERQVALKVLKPDLAAALGAERFHREIQIAAQLQHPHILPLLDSGEAGGFLYYVMPYVEGHSLRERLAREGALPIADAVRVLRDVADALTEAHTHGVVHRDIKPENIMLRGRHALVTDFGVAKAVSEATGLQGLTTAGMALGTPAYMAPEQASADPHVDHRADLYALGAVGYEMLTGRPVFMGTTSRMVLSAHVTEAPAPVSKHRETVPPALEALVMRCLEKQAADRWQSADEVLAQLEALATPSGGVTPTGTHPVVRRMPRPGAIAVAAAAGVVVLVAAPFAVRVAMSRPFSVTASQITQVTRQPGVEYQPAISADGNEVVYAAGAIGAPRLFMRSTVRVSGGGEAPVVSDTAFGFEILPSWSADGQLVRFWGCRSDGCAWMEAPKLGGLIRRTGVTGRPVWSADDRHVALFRADSIFVVTPPDTAARLVAVHGEALSELHSLAWSPDGRMLAYVNGNPQWRTSANTANSDIWVVPAAGGEPRRVTDTEHLNVSPAWLDGRRLLYVSNRDGPRAVYVVEVGPAGARGVPQLVPGVSDPHSITYSPASGRLAYSKLTVRQNIWSYPLAVSRPTSIRDGRPVTAENNVIETHDISPDGGRIVYDGNRRGNADLYVMPLAGGEPVPVTANPDDEFGPRWSPDGREIAFYGWAPSGTAEIGVVAAEGGPITWVTRSEAFANVPCWSPDGLTIAFSTTRSGDRYRIWTVTRDSVGGPWHGERPVSRSVARCDDWAPDGSGMLSPFGIELIAPNGDVVWRRELEAVYGLLTAEFSTARFTRDGRWIILSAQHRDGRRGVWAIPAASGGSARLVVAFDDPTLTSPGFLSVSADRVFVTVAEYESDIWVARISW